MNTEWVKASSPREAMTLAQFKPSDLARVESVSVKKLSETQYEVTYSLMKPDDPLPEHVLFSRRRELERKAEEWCCEQGIPANIFNSITGLLAMGLIQESNT